MRIVYVSQYYPPEIGAPSARVSELARQWAQRGHQVTVLTAFAHHPHGVKRPEDRGVLTRREKDGGVDVVRVYVYAARNAGFFRRILSYLSFMLSAMLIGVWRVGPADVVVATSPQLFTGIAGWWIGKWRSAAFVFEVRDLWPESIVTVGAMRKGRGIALLQRLAAWLYRSADHIVTVGEGYRRRLLELYPVSPDKISVVTNGVDLDRFNFDDSIRRSTRAELGWEDRTVVLYLGTHGMAHGLEFVLCAAERLRGDSQYLFALIGDGAEKPRLEEMARRAKLDNVRFYPAADKEAVVSRYAAADICLVPLRKVELFTDVLPSKLFEIMAMRRPIVLSVDGEARKLVERSGSGLFIEPENVDQLCAALQSIRQDPELARSLGEGGRRHVEEYFSRPVLARRYLTLLDRLARGEGVSATASAAQIGQ